MTSPVSIPAGHELVAPDFDAYENATAVWVTWVPVLGNLTSTGATITAKYRQVGKTVDYRFKFKLGAASAVGTAPNFTLPVAPHADYVVDEDRLGTGRLLDAATTAYDAMIRLAGASTVDFAVLVASGAVTSASPVTATVPFTWGTNDTLMAAGTYEAA